MCVPCVARRILNHWTTREIPNLSSIFSIHASLLRFHIIFIITLNSFSGRLPVSSSCIWACRFFTCTFTWKIFLPSVSFFFDGWDCVPIFWVRKIWRRASHSSILTWRSPWTEKPGGPQSIGSQRMRQTEATSHTHVPVLLAVWPSASSTVVCRHLGRAGSWCQDQDLRETSLQLIFPGVWGSLLI